MIKEREFFTESGELVPGFKGIGGFRGPRASEFTEEQRIILRYFFTNIDSNTYCATDNMPSQLWALLLGQYARSPVTAKERLLQLFEDVHKKDSKNVPSLEQIAQAINQNEDISSMLQAHYLRSGIFVDEHGVKYGHSSLRDSGTIRICFEGVSQRATKFLEAAREGAYQEQSTRALPFTVENLGMPLEVRETEFEKRFLYFGEKASKLYSEIQNSAIDYLNFEYAHLREEANKELNNVTGEKTARLTEGEWNGVIGAKAFDIARSLLPQYMTTSLGMTLTARRFQDMLTEWQSSEFEEMRVLGRAAQIEAMNVMPTLMKHGNPSDFYAQLPQRRRNLNFRFVTSRDIPYENLPIKSKLIASTPDLEDLVLASILFNGSDSSHSLEELKQIVSKLSFEQRREIAISQFEGKQSYELVPKTMEIGAVIFERTYDIGAYRDLHRQRGDRQQIAPYTTFAYHMPGEISKLGGNLESRFHGVARDAKRLYTDLKSAGMHSVAECVPIMANLIMHVVTKDPVQCFYEAPLRTQAAGVDSYRLIERQEIHQLLTLMPSFKGLVEFDDTPNYPLNRLPEAIKKAIDRVNRKKIK